MVAVVMPPNRRTRGAAAESNDSDVDGTVRTPGAGGNLDSALRDIQRLLNHDRQRRRTTGSDDEAEEPEPAQMLEHAIDDAHAQERQLFVQRIEHIYEGEVGGEEDDDMVRSREREAVRTNRQNGRMTKVSCFMCSYGNHDHDGTADKGSKPFANLCNMMTQRYPYSDMQTLCMDCCEYYTTALREPSRQADGTYLLPEQLPSDFYKHILYHNLNPTILVGEDLRFIRDLLLVLRIQLTHATGKTGLRIIDAIIKLMKQKATYLAQGARPLMFEGRNTNNPLVMDPQAMGEVANMTRIRPYLQSTQTNVIGGATATNTSRPRQGLPRFDRMQSAVNENDVEDEEDDDPMDDESVRTSPES